MSGRQQDVIEYLRGKDWTSPTEIGGKVWGPPHHSSSASPVCKQLVARGLLERNDRGHYRLLTKSNFETWFKNQFGPPPKMPVLYRPDNSSQAVYLGQQHERYSKDVGKYEARKDAALKAWCARDKKGGR